MVIYFNFFFFLGLLVLFFVISSLPLFSSFPIFAKIVERFCYESSRWFIISSNLYFIYFLIVLLVYMGAYCLMEVKHLNGQFGPFQILLLTPHQSDKSITKSRIWWSPQAINDETGDLVQIGTFPWYLIRRSQIQKFYSS